MIRLSRDTENQRLIASYHEAGHATAVLACGGEVRQLTMNNCRYRVSEPFHDLIVAHAGAKAARYHGPRWRSQNRRMSPGDREIMEDALERMGPDRSVTTVERAKQYARDFVTWKHGSAVKRIAKALRRAGELSRSQTRRLFDGESVEDVLADPAMAAPKQPAGKPASSGLVANFYPEPDGGWIAVGPPDDEGKPLEGVGPTPDDAFAALETVAAGPTA